LDYFTRGNHFNKQLPTSCVCRCWGIARDLAVEWTIESAIVMNRRENVNRQCTRLASRLAIRKSSLLIDHCSTRSERITRSAEFRSGGSIIMQSRYAIVAPRAHCCQCSHGECRIPTQWHCLLTAEQDTPILCRTLLCSRRPKAARIIHASLAFAVFLPRANIAFALSRTSARLPGDMEIDNGAFL